VRRSSLVGGDGVMLRCTAATRASFLEMLLQELCEL